MTPKINQQGQKYYEILSEEYISLKEKEMLLLMGNIHMFERLDREVPEILREQLKELQSHIEDLKAEL